MRRGKHLLLLTVSVVLLAGCATSALDMAPPDANQPWTPATNNEGIIQPDQAAKHDINHGYTLPANRTLDRPPVVTRFDARHTYTLPELIDIAQSSNPATRVAWDKARNAALAAGIAKSSYLPEISATVIGGYESAHNRASAAAGTHSPPTAVHVDGDNHVDGSGTVSAVSLRWLLFEFGKRPAVLKAALQASVISNIAFTAAHQQLIYQVSLAYYAWVAATKRDETTVETLQNAIAVQAAAEARYKRGIGTVMEVSEARQATAQAQLQRVHAKGAVQNTHLALLSAMGLSPLTTIAIATPPRRKLSPALDAPIDQLVRSALTRRPDTLTAYAARAASLARLRAAKAEFLPKLFFTANESYATGALNLTSLPGIAGTSPSINVSTHRLQTTLLLGVSIPIYAGGTRSALLDQARNDIDSAKARLRQVKTEATRQIVQAANTVKTSLSAYTAATALVAASQTTFDAALAAYHHDVGSMTAVSVAETKLLEARNAATDAYGNALSAAATLAMAAGTLGTGKR